MTVRRLTHLLPAGLLGLGAAVLVSCGSSGAGLIPAGNAQPLVKDFQAVEAAATKGNGDCTATKAALHTTERDFQSLPTDVNAGLRSRLHEGIVHLQSLALELCAQPPTGTTSTAGTTTTPPPAKTKSTPPTSTGETTGTTENGATPGATTPSGGAEGGTSPETEEGNGEAGGAEGAGQGGGAAAGGGHEDNGLGNGGESGNGGAGVPGGSEK